MANNARYVELFVFVAEIPHSGPLVMQVFPLEEHSSRKLKSFVWDDLGRVNTVTFSKYSKDNMFAPHLSKGSPSGSEDLITECIESTSFHSMGFSSEGGFGQNFSFQDELLVLVRGFSFTNLLQHEHGGLHSGGLFIIPSRGFKLEVIADHDFLFDVIPLRYVLGQVFTSGRVGSEGFGFGRVRFLPTQFVEFKSLLICEQQLVFVLVCGALIGIVNV